MKEIEKQNTVLILTILAAEAKNQLHVGQLAGAWATIEYFLQRIYSFIQLLLKYRLSFGIHTKNLLIFIAFTSCSRKIYLKKFF